MEPRAAVTSFPAKQCGAVRGRRAIHSPGGQTHVEPCATEEEGARGGGQGGPPPTQAPPTSSPPSAPATWPALHAPAGPLLRAAALHHRDRAAHAPLPRRADALPIQAEAVRARCERSAVE